MTRSRRRRQSGQALILVAVALLALIGTAALALLAGSAAWQRNQLQTLADSAALDSALKVGLSCSAGAASTVITEADNFVATQRTRSGALSITAGTCATPYHGTDTFTGGLTADYYYPYAAHQQQVEVVLTLALPISFGAAVGKTSTTITRYAVAQALPASVEVVSATSFGCTSGQVNIAGDIQVQNAITLAGGCAIYAHVRTAAGSYSSLANISDYTDAQAWTGVGGACVAGANAGSVSAICADGIEISGHQAPTCGTAGTSRLLAADAAVNANPCAAGVGPRPVPTLPSTRPPDPNADPAAVATLVGTGGVACSAAGVYPAITVSGSTVATGLAPAPTKDAANFYHFKPSCYGYINPGALSGVATITNVQIGPEVKLNSGNVTPTMAAGSTAGDLLVVSIVGGNNVSPFAGPAGWIKAASTSQAGDGETEIWYLPNCAAGVSSATFTSGSATSIAQMSEWRGAATVAPVDRTGTSTSAANVTTSIVSTAAADTTAGDLGVTVTTWTTGNFTTGPGWTSLYLDDPIASASAYHLNLPAAVASETMTSSSATLWSNVIVTFKPNPTAGAGAVLDPGFYYFNGSGLGGGGGLCLNGGTLLARDVTLEFVNQAGFSSGDCAVGGPTTCVSAGCTFGSDPASGLVDTSYSWFAAPCSQDPTASPDASCLGGASWCPTGDRSCWNVLAWTPAAATGEIAIKGASAKHWILGSVYWAGTCTDAVNGTSTIAGSVSCGTLSISAAAGAGTAIGSDYGLGTATVEAVLVE